MSTRLSPLSRLREAITLPVLMKEMRSRMRGNRAPILLFVCTALTVGVALLMQWLVWPQMSSLPDSYRTTLFGKLFFLALTLVEGLICLFIIPALTAGAITLEKEQQTIELLFLTRLSGKNILLGKLLSALSLIGIILLCALPVEAIVFLVGGVSLSQLFWDSALIFTAAALLGAVGINFSVRTAKSSVAIILSYGACLAWLVGMPFLFGLLTAYSTELDYQFGIMLFCLMALVAILPVCLIVIAVSLLLRRPTSWIFNGLLWIVGIGIGMAICYQDPKIFANIAMRSPQYIILFHPIFALYLEHMLDTSFMPAGWRLDYLMPISTSILLLGAWVAMVFASWGFRRLRSEQAPARQMARGAGHA